MRVLHVLASMGPVRGGPSFVLRNMAAGLAERGVQTDVVTTDDNGPERLDIPLSVATMEHGATYRYFPRQLRHYTVSLPLAKWLWQNVASYDLIHIHAVFTFASTVAAWIARVKHVPYIVRPLGILNQWGLRNRRPILKKVSLRAIERGILRRAAVIHYTSDLERIEAEQVGVHTNYVIIANPLDIDLADREQYAGNFRARYPGLGTRKLIVFLSRITEKKGLDLLIPAFAALHRQLPETVLVIAGDGSNEMIQPLKQQTIDAGIAESVLWVGFLHGDDKRALLADADIFVLPSYSENFGVAVVEALAFQVPVVVSDQVGIHHEVSEYAAGLVIPCEPAALADALARIVSMPELRTEMANNAGRLMMDRFSRQGIFDLLINTYQSVLKQKPTP